MGRLEDIEARAAAAYPGPWIVRFRWDSMPLVIGANGGEVASCCDKRNSYFVANAREDISWLIDEVRRLREENKKVAKGVA